MVIVNIQNYIDALTIQIEKKTAIEFRTKSSSWIK